jgi:hypothetical protein
MRYIEHETLDGKKHRKLTPAVLNLLFIEKEFTEKELLERVKDCTIPFLLVRDRSTRRCYEIPDCEMLEFRAVCDPNYKGTLYVDTVTAEARPGQAVRVIRGPFAGLEVGQLLGDIFPMLAGQARKDSTGRLPFQAVTQETAAADDFLGACQVGILGTGAQAQAEQAAGDKMACDFFQGDPLSVFFDLYHKIINRLHWPFKP